MARRSPRVTRSHRKTGDEDDSFEDPSEDFSLDTSKADLYLSATSINSQGRNESYSDDLGDSRSCSSLLSNSPNESVKSYSSSHSSRKSPRPSTRLYPSFSKDALDVSDENVSLRRKHRSRLYPELDSSKEQNSDEEKTPSRKKSSFRRESVEFSSGSGNCYLLLVVVLILFCVASGLVFMVTAGSSGADTKNSTKTGYATFEEEIKILKRSFPSQTTRFWNTVSASARHVYTQEDPCYPSVILMATQSKNHLLNNCLANKIAGIFSLSRGVRSQPSKIYTNVDEFKHLESEKQKLELDNLLQAAFLQAGEKAFVIQNIHSLSPKAALLLHGFCDGDNAPFKDVMIILTFHVDDSSVIQHHKQVEPLLTKIWSRDLDMDKLSAVMSRIANNALVSNPESDETVRAHCL